MLQRYWLSCLILVFIFSGSAFAKPIHIVFDLDWTIFYSIDPKDPLQMDDKVIQVEGKYYRATDHIAEVLRHLLHYSDVKIYFFSGGEKSRNLQLLRSIKIDKNKTAEDIATGIFNRDDLTVVSKNQKLSFEERNKKEIQKLIPDFDSQNTILIDDKPKFATEAVVAVPSFGIFNFTKKFDAEKSDLPYFPKTSAFWKLERNKALLWMEMIDQAMAPPAGQSFSGWIKRIWSDRQFMAPMKCSKVHSNL